MGNDTILAEIIADVAAILGPELAGITVTRAVIGVYFTGVALSTGTAGVCATPAKTDIHAACCPATADTVIPPGTLRGRRAGELLAEISSPHALRRAAGIATLNALAEAGWQRRPHPGIVLREQTDALGPPPPSRRASTSCWSAPSSPSCALSSAWRSPTPCWNSTPPC